MKKWLALLMVAAMIAPLLAACAPAPTPQVIEKPVTVVVEKEKVVEKPVIQTVVVEKQVPIEKVVQATVVVEKEKVVKETVVVEKEKEVIKVVTPTPVPSPSPTPMPAFNIPFKNPDTLIVATIGEPETLDPAWTYETSGAEKEMNIYEGLVFFKRTSTDEFVPALAEKWEVSPDLKTYTFYIRKGIKFHEGGTLEPHDIAYSLQRGMLQDRVDGPQWMFLDAFLGVHSIEELAMQIGKVDDFAKVDAAALKKTAEAVMAAVQADDAKGTVTLNLHHPTPWILQLLSQPWGAALDMEWMVAQGDWDGKAENWVKWHNPSPEGTALFNKANGTGPYKLDHWTPGEEIVLVANENYWRKEPLWEGGPSGVPKIKRVVFKLVEEWGTRLAMLQAGDADIVDVPRAYIAQVDPMVKDIYTGWDKTAPHQVYNPKGALRLFKDLPSTAMTPAMFNFKINTEGGNPFIGSGKLDGNGIPPDFFSDIDIRKAFNYCMDWETLIRDALQGEGVQPKGPIIEGMLGYDPNQPTYTFDLKKAEEHFKKAWGGQVWEKGFYVQIAYNTGNELRRIAAEILEQNVEAINPKFDIVVLNLPWPSYLAARRERKLPISISGWLEDYHDPSNWVEPFMNCEVGAYARAQGFPEEFCTKAAELMKKGVSSVDPKVREPYYKELQNMAYEWAIDIFLYQGVGRHYEQLWVDGWYYNPIYPGLYVYALSKVAP